MVCSSMVEHSAVNRGVVGSSPTLPVNSKLGYADRKALPLCLFVVFVKIAEYVSQAYIIISSGGIEMNFKELFIDKSKTLLVNTDLAMVLGDLNEAIVLNQLNYWLEINKRAEKHFVDGKYWVYNSYSGWKTDNFPYWSEKTIQRVFTRLESKGVVISANYNRASFDKTKWYTINEIRLQELIDEYFSQDNLYSSQDNMTDDKDNLTRREGQNDRPIPEITTDITNIDYNTEITDKVNTSDKSDVKVNTFPTGKGESAKLTRKQLEEKQSDMIKRFDNICDEHLTTNPVVRDCVKKVFKKYIDKYNERTNRIHPILEDTTLLRICKTFAGANCDDSSIFSAIDTYTPYDGITAFEEMVDWHFAREHRKNTNWSIAHFANSEYLDKLASGLI